MSEHPDRISVNATREIWVHPQSADIRFQVKGYSTLSATQTMKTAKEVEELISELVKAGVNDGAIYVESVEFESTKGIISGNSHALFKVAVVDVETDKVSSCLGVGASQRGVSVENVRWDFGDLREERLELLRQVSSDCLQYADTVAKSLGIKRGHICFSDLEWKEPVDGDPNESYPPGNIMFKTRGGGRPPHQSFRFTIQRRSLLAVTMKAEFRSLEA